MSLCVCVCVCVCLSLSLAREARRHTLSTRAEILLPWLFHPVLRAQSLASLRPRGPRERVI